MSDPILCCVCGIPDRRLVRISWSEDPSDVSGFRPILIVPVQPKSNDVLVCEDCIRGIKRLPFSDIALSPPVGNFEPPF